MRTEHYWQTAGNHKSNVGGGSVFSELSVARLLFINQGALPNKRSVGEARITTVSFLQLDKTLIIMQWALCLIHNPSIIHKNGYLGFYHILAVAVHSDSIAKLCYRFCALNINLV